MVCCGGRQLHQVKPVHARFDLKEQLLDVPENVEIITDSFVNDQGLKLQTYRFSPKFSPNVKAKGIIWLCHGYAVHTAFEWFLPLKPGQPHCVWKGSIPSGLVDAGYVVCTLDQQSHGHSEGIQGLRCYFEHFDDLMRENLKYLTTCVLNESSFEGLFVFVLGISMGGATAIRMAQSRPDLFRGVVLYAPMLSLEKVKQQRIALCIKNGHLKPLINCLDIVIPKKPIAKTARNTVHPKSQEEMDNDPLTYSGDCRVHVAKEFSEITDWFLKDGLCKVQTPFVTFHSVKDTFTDPFGSQKLFEMSPCLDKTYKRVGKGLDIDVDIWHALASETNHEVIFKNALQWIVEHT